MEGISPLDDGDPHDGVGTRPVRLQEFFLPIHGYVRLRPEEIAVVDHPAFQRLRRCRQLGFAHLVFPAAVHTRFEHSIGAVYVADKIVQYVNFNHDSYPLERAERDQFRIGKIEDVARSFIRLGALLHDIGHIPFGHTLEDELEHLAKHDGEERIKLLADKKHTYIVDPALRLDLEAPDGGWSLEALVDAAYQPRIDQLFPEGKARLSAFEVVKLITLKPPGSRDAGRAEWRRREEILGEVLPLSVCRDIIGNTICADFLDYIFRDWYHVGKPMTEDRRLYQYMEVRAPKDRHTEKSEQQFVINVGPDQKLRHDALTCIFELLEARYKLAETVLFHRTKLAMTALLDRCFLELRHLYDRAGVRGRHSDAGQYLADRALHLLLESGDDQIADVVRELARGIGEDNAALNKAARRFEDHINRPVNSADSSAQSGFLGQLSTDEELPPFDVAGQRAVIEELSRRLENRTMYTQACRLPRRWLDEKHRPVPTPATLPEEIRRLADPAVRRKQIVMIESLLDLPTGSVTLYAPTTAKMNAKIAEVKLLIDKDIVSFSEYEKRRGQYSLTGGVLGAQVLRFHELWGVSIYVDRPQWHLYAASEAGDELQGNVEELLRNSVYIHPRESKSASALRRTFESTIEAARVATNRAKEPAHDHAADERSPYSTEKFTSGLPYSSG